MKFSWLFKKPNYWIINCNPYYTINNQTYVNIMAGYIKPGESKTIILPRGIHAELKINKNNKIINLDNDDNYNISISKALFSHKIEITSSRIDGPKNFVVLK